MFCINGLFLVSCQLTAQLLSSLLSQEPGRLGVNIPRACGLPAAYQAPWLPVMESGTLEVLVAVD